MDLSSRGPSILWFPGWLLTVGKQTLDDTAHCSDEHAIFKCKEMNDWPDCEEHMHTKVRVQHMEMVNGIGAADKQQQCYEMWRTIIYRTHAQKPNKQTKHIIIIFY